jgi:signal transduction histidine kinase/DNA-binding response OmpR family regulator
MLYFGYCRFKEQVTDLENSLEVLSEPDVLQRRIGDLRSGFDQMRSTVRSYNISGEHEFLEQFYSQKDSLVVIADQLKQHDADYRPSVQMDSLLQLFDRKTMLYDSLLQIQYYKEVTGSLNDLADINIPVRTYEVTGDDGNIIQRLFSSRYSRKALQARSDSIIERRNRDIITYNRSQKALKEKERLELDSLAMTELELVQVDMMIDKKISAVISAVSAAQESTSHAARTMVAENAMDRLRQLRLMLTGGLLLLCIMLVALLLQIRRAMLSARAIAKARENAEVLARGRQEFLATMSHEIRTPLSAISGMVKKLRTRTDPDDELIVSLASSVDHLNYVVNDVLDDARMERGDLLLQEVNFSPLDLVNELAAQFTLQCSKKGVTFVLQNEIQNDQWFQGDPVRLRQVIYNVVGNAVKFTSRGSVSLKASAISSDDIQELHLKVTDTGPGIPPEKIDTIFDRFTGSPGHDNKQSFGAGLGLSITKRIVEQQGGTVTVESTIGSGTAFDIMIPFREGELPVVPLNEQHSQGPEKVLQGIVVVYLEDDPFIAELLKSDLTDAGADVRHHFSYDAFKGHTADLSPLVYIIDLQIGEVSGLDVLNDLKAGLNKMTVDSSCFIAVTANPYLREQAITAGFNEVLIKPVGSDKLIAAIIHCLSEKPSVPPVQGTKMFDLTELEKAANGNEEFVKRMINVFMTTSFAGVTNLLTYAKSGDNIKAGSTAHRLAPSFEQMGVIGLAAKLREIEALSADPGNVQRIEIMAAEMKKELREVIGELKEVSKQMRYEK